MKNAITLLGSTGSIGRQTLEVCAQMGVRVAALAAHHSVDLLERQVREFHPDLAVLYDMDAALELAKRLKGLPVRVAYGMEGLVEAASLPESGTVVAAMVGMVGLQPTLAAIRRGKRIALANKETLVCAGELVMEEAERHGVDIVPVDSEHSALFQCLQGNRDRGEVKRIILTCSGGPFFGRTAAELEHIAPADALKHPNWSMGAKITIDSATLMNKGLEFIEAMRLYRMQPEKIAVVIHRESIIHSLVEYCDNAVLAQLGEADMRLPIQYALTWPERKAGPARALDLLSCPPLTFARPDPEAFRCLGLALEAARTGGLACAVLNGANEAAVGLFLRGKIGFCDIARRVERALARVPEGDPRDLDHILAADRAAREIALQ